MRRGQAPFLSWRPKSPYFSCYGLIRSGFGEFKLRLKALTLQNFRRYRIRTVIDIDEVTAFIGRGDAGKSTILEALDIFFEGGVIKIDPADACYLR